MDYYLILEYAFRVLLSMIIGGMIGWEREATQRPAGLRTHMLVSVGATIVMLLGEYTTNKYMGVTNLDPSRLGAQVISGIGFLGAGTIMKEGLSIKGLTTAASLWVVACLGLAAGGGAYEIAIIGFIAVLLTLTVFEYASLYVRGGKLTRFHIKLQCQNIGEGLVHINQIADSYEAEISNIQIKQESGLYKLSFKLSPLTTARASIYTDLVMKLAEFEDMQDIRVYKI